MAARPAIAMAPKLASTFMARPVNGRMLVGVDAGVEVWVVVGAKVVSFEVSVDEIGVETEITGIVTTPGVLTVYGVEPMVSVVGVGKYVVE